GTCLALILRAWFFVGLPQGPMADVVHGWAFTITVALPMTTGFALLRPARSWRPFVGWWLLVVGVLALGSMLWAFPLYQGWPQSLGVGSAVCVLPSIASGLFLLLRVRQASPPEPVSQRGPPAASDGTIQEEGSLDSGARRPADGPAREGHCSCNLFTK